MRPDQGASPVVGRRIRDLRKERRWTQGDLAERLSQPGAAVSQARVSEWESGATGVGFDNALRLASVLRCSVDYLVGLADDPRPPHVDPDAAERLALIRELAAGAPLSEIRERLAMTPGVAARYAGIVDEEAARQSEAAARATRPAAESATSRQKKPRPA